MKLLFEKNGANGSGELKSLLGFIDADIKFDKIKPDVITATNELIKLIGRELYDLILTKYVGGSADENDTHLIYLTRYPIAINAYMLLAPSNDISHTNNGRKMRQDNNEKQAFEWMLDRDNEALAKRYYRALDDLIAYLDSNVDEWKDSDAYKKLKQLFVNTTDQFNDLFNIDSRLILLKLEPGLRQCEQNEIIPRVGKDKVNALKEKLSLDTDLDEAEEELVALIREACVYYSLSWAMIRLAVNIFPEGILQAFTSDRMSTKGKMPAALSEPERARQAFASDADRIFTRIEELLKPTPATPNTTETESNSAAYITGTNFIST